MCRRPQFTRMFDKQSGSLTQDRINVRLVQRNGYLYEPVESSDPQLLLLPASDRMSCFNAVDCPASIPHHRAEFALCLRQTGHAVTSPTLRLTQKARRVRGAIILRTAPSGYSPTFLTCWQRTAR